ncbi:MAG: flippase [archaeon]
MINTIKNKFIKNKLLFENFFSLSTLQAVNYVIPLLTLPYLVRVLGPDKFGLVVFAQAFVTYFVLITDYGFNFSATREISINRNNIKKISKIFYSIFVVKIILFFLSLIIFLILVFIVPKFRQEYLLFLFSFMYVLGALFFPTWLFQGMEKMKYITIINVLIKLIFIIPIFIFIQTKSDYILVPIINSLSFLICGLVGFLVAIKIFKINFLVPSKTEIIYQFKEGWHIFISTIFISVYTTSNVFILGLFTNNTMVGYYSASEKIIKACQGLIAPISQALYPHISKLVSESRQKTLIFLKKLTVIIGIGTFLISSIMFIFAEQIVLIILGPDYILSILILRILAFIPFIIALSNIFGVLGLFNFNKQKVVAKIIIFGAIISLTLTLLLIPVYQAIGVAISWLVTEIFITASFLYYLKKEAEKND